MRGNEEEGVEGTVRLMIMVMIVYFPKIYTRWCGKILSRKGTNLFAEETEHIPIGKIICTHVKIEIIVRSTINSMLIIRWRA